MKLSKNTLTTINNFCESLYVYEHIKAIKFSPIYLKLHIIYKCLGREKEKKAKRSISRLQNSSALSITTELAKIEQTLQFCSPECQILHALKKDKK